MMLASSPRRLIDRCLAALTDPIRREYAIACVLAIYAVLWTLFGVLAKANQDIHYDAAEIVAWSREPALGYPKHPPLAAWLVRGWFSIFQLTDWTYYLLAMTSIAVALWFAWRLFTSALPPRKAVVGLTLLTLIPFFNFHALRFDHNTVLIPLWAGTTLYFVRSLDTGRLLFAVLAGAFAAAAMLGKYWSVFLLMGLGLAALIHPQRERYFRSAAPWITVAVGLIGLMPHLAWLFAHDFGPFHYALAAHELGSPSSSIKVALGYLLGGAGYTAFPILLALSLARPDRAVLCDIAAPRDPTRRFYAMAFWAPLLLPVLLALVASLELNSTWVMPGLILLPIVLLAPPTVEIGLAASRAIVATAALLPVLAICAAPWFALYNHRAGGVTPTAAHSRLLAQRIDQEWRRTSSQPLRLVGGDLDLAYVTSFYLPDRPSAFPISSPELSPWVDADRIAREGIALVCHVSERGPFCLHKAVLERIDALAAHNSGSRRVEVEVARRYFGVPGPSARYIIVTVPPER